MVISEISKQLWICDLAFQLIHQCSQQQYAHQPKIATYDQIAYLAINAGFLRFVHNLVSRSFFEIFATLFRLMCSRRHDIAFVRPQVRCCVHDVWHGLWGSQQQQLQ